LANTQFTIHLISSSGYSETKASEVLLKLQNYGEYHYQFIIIHKIWPNSCSYYI